ncbi:flagella biosynthesis regulatory protein FliT [Pectobacterium aquaticum]|uniref:flagella biosynthesis regulatory protein FliT n=1 Tax=Pectobacterium aquaticum TaxID=2204145 RepID=UPI001F0E8009|nr:flagella biosynthesis regulatory protein FliT [Pectobacterium aquaticum]MCH5052350.1 flagella biosynthesis regulatory protein FliT [Pectobacterium aquaticum]
MSNLQPLLVNYQQLLTLSCHMLALASNGQWDELVNQEIVYVRRVETVSKVILPAEIDSVLKLHLKEILNEILENESKIKTLLHKRMSELNELMQNSLRQQNVNNIYGQFAKNRLLPGEPQL